MYVACGPEKQYILAMAILTNMHLQHASMK